MRKPRAAVPAEPALQRAALALGGARRRGGIAAAARAPACAITTAASLATYARMVAGDGPQVGRVLQALDADGLSDNTIVIFTSDNGGERFSDTWPFTGKKTELLEGGLRVPALVRWPDRIPAGRTSEQVTITMDWLPTLLAAAGAAPDPDYPPDGINLLPVLTGSVRPCTAQAVLALQDQRAAGRARRRSEVSSRSATTRSCSTWSPIRSSGPT